MMNRTNPMRHHTRFPVRWPVLYGGDEFLAEGTVLDLTRTGWRIAGAMPVRPGMPLTLAVWAPEKLEPVRIERATVLWVNGCEFAIEAHQMVPADQAWVTEFLNQKLGLSWISRPTGDQPSSEPTTETSPGVSSLHQTHPPNDEATMRRLLAIQPDRKDLDAPLTQRDTAEICRQEEEDDRAVSDHFLHEVLFPALRIVRGMRARKARHQLTGEDSIANN